MIRRGIFCLLAVYFASITASHADTAAPPAAQPCLEVTLFVTTTCPHCLAAREFMRDLQSRDTRLQVAMLEINQDQQAKEEFIAFNRKNAIERPGVPTFSICGQTIIGFEPQQVENAIYHPRASDPDETVVELPLLGKIELADVGLPLFTIALGLLDGFNPCAMWVLLFLLSILVHVKSRRRIALIASTFVLISGLVYFAFMAAWLNAFLFLGYSRLIQVIIGVVAIFIGLIHLKDFFALHQGISLSIPDSAKPAIYQRVRQVVRSEKTVVALLGVTLLAVLVNFLELLCTAGLPALYTQILSQQELTTTGYYAYLALYNAAYIVDDGLMVAVAVITLGPHRLQEKQGRWLKLVSGTIVFILGGLLITAPELLSF